MAWYTSAIVLLIIGVGAVMGIAGAILKKLGVEEAADILEKLGLGVIVGILIGFNILIILSSFEILEPNAWAVGGFLLMLLIFLSLYKSGGAGSVYILSILVLLFGYVMTGPYSGYVKHTLGDVVEPLGIGWEALKGTLGDIKLMITDPMAYMQKQRQTTVRPEKPTISYPKGVELKSLNVMPDAVPIGERFYIQVMAENEGDITATNVNITASCKDRCELGDDAITMLPKESEQPKTLKQYEVILGRFGPFNATGEEKDVGREAEVEINLSYEHASNSTLLVEVMSDSEVKRIMTDPIARENLFKPVVATGKNAPAMLALSVGYQPLFAGEPQVLLVSVVNKRPDGNVILPKDSTVEIALPGSIGSDLKCHSSEVFECEETGESATCTVKKERTIEPKEYYPITCEFTSNNDVDISTTDIITGKLSKYVFETSKEKGATIMMSYKPKTSEGESGFSWSECESQVDKWENCEDYCNSVGKEFGEKKCDYNDDKMSLEIWKDSNDCDGNPDEVSESGRIDIYADANSFKCCCGKSGDTTTTTVSEGVGCKGDIITVTHEKVGTPKDEIKVDTTFKNTGSKECEYRVYLYNAKMEEMEKEPDTIWKNVDAGKEATITINSNFDPSWDIDDLGGSYTVILKEQHDGEMDRETKEI